MMKTVLQKSLGYLAISAGLLGMTLPMSGYAWHGHHGRHRWWRHNGGAVVAATMVGLAVGAVAAGNSARYGAHECYTRSESRWIPGHYRRYSGYWVPGHYRYYDVRRCY